MPIVCQDCSMLECPQSKFPWCANLAYGGGVSSREDNCPLGVRGPEVPS